MERKKAQALFQQTKGALKAVEELEKEAISYWVLESIFGLNRTGVLVDEVVEVTPEKEAALQAVLKRINAHEPLQYVLGEAFFYGRKFLVNSNVLIPRPETEELVHLMVNDLRDKPIKVLDIGTGSGCIAITLSKEITTAEIQAMDVSSAALATAERNAALHFSKVQFFQQDILDEVVLDNDFDVWVSNPPYVRELEKKQMAKRVLEFEPEKALFVPDDDALLFYQRIAHLGLNHIKSGGRLYLEINEAFGSEVKQMLEAVGYQQVAIHKDLQGKDRMISAVR